MVGIKIGIPAGDKIKDIMLEPRLISISRLTRAGGEREFVMPGSFQRLHMMWSGRNRGRELSTLKRV
jgi:hypothetical protein